MDRIQPRQLKTEKEVEMTDWRKITHVDIAGGQGNYFPPDFKGKLKVDKIFTYNTRNKGSAFIVDFTVLTSNMEKVAVGSTHNWFQKMQDEDVAFRAIKEFMLRLLGVDESDEEEMEEFSKSLPDMLDEVADEQWRQKAAEEHPLNGNTIALETWHKETNNNRDFTVHKWTTWHAEEGEVDELLEAG